MSWVFIDESGTKKQDKYFSIGFLQLENPDKYYKTLNLYRDKLFGISRKERNQRVEDLFKQGKNEELLKFAKNPFKFELKYSKINNYNLNLYKAFISTLISVIDKIVVISIDREDPEFHDTSGLRASYKRILNTFFKKYNKDSEINVAILDDFGIKFSEAIDTTLLPDSFLRNDSSSNIFLQGVDVVTGLIGFGLRDLDGLENQSKKNVIRRELLNIILSNIGIDTFKKNITTNNKTYFSSWVLDFSKGHGH